MRTIQECIAEIKAAQEAGTYTRCPRCGENTMKLGDRLATNALSRSYDIMICDLCYPRKTVIRGNMTKLP